MRVKIFFLMKGQAFINANRKNRRFGGGGRVKEEASGYEIHACPF